MIERNIYVHKKTNVPPVYVVYGSDSVSIKINLLDYDIPSGATATAYASLRRGSTVYTNLATISGNSITVSPAVGFFVPGENNLQIDVTYNSKKLVTFALDVNCEGQLSSNGSATTPSIRTVAQVDADLTTLTTTVNNKVDKVAGKGLSSNDYTDSAKAKVDAIPADPKYTDTVYDDTQIKSDLNAITTITKNVNTSGIARKYINVSGKFVAAPGGKYLGIGDFVNCVSSTTYTVTFYGIKVSDTTPTVGYRYYVGFRKNNTETPFERIDSGNSAVYSNHYTFTTPSDAYEMYVQIRREAGVLAADGTPITDDTAFNSITCQIEVGGESTNYSEPFSAVDTIARHKIDSLGLIEPPDYFKENIASACSAANSKIAAIGLDDSGMYNDGIQFIFFSDPHWELNAKNSPALIYYAKNNTSSKYVVCTGDAINLSTTKSGAIDILNDFADSFKCIAPLEFTFGNHDRNQIGTVESRMLSDIEVYSTVFRNVSTNANWTGYFNYYIDDLKSNTRLIFVTQFYNGTQYTTQEAWIRETAASSQNMNTIYFMHSTQTQDEYHTEGSATHLPTIKEMHDTYGNVRAVFSGHRHYDAVECYQSDVAGRSSVPIIAIDADCMSRLKNYDGTDRTSAEKGTIDEQCIDIVTMHYSANAVYCSRIGRGSSRTIVDGEEVTA